MTLQEMIEDVRSLSPEERQQLIQAIEIMIREPLSEAHPAKHNLLELAGLGAEIWEGIDAQAYINQLRSEWDHRP
jgi:hypothetical protein